MKTWGSDDGRVELYLADCLEVLPDLGDIESCITDPPYGLGFMGKEWDAPGAPSFFERASQGKRWDKVGGHHNPINGEDRARTRRREGEVYQAAVEFWFTDVAKALKPGAAVLAFSAPRNFHRFICGVEAAGLEVRDLIMWLYGQGMPKGYNIAKGSGDDRWDGWNTALKPAWEPILLAMKEVPFNFVDNAEEHGVAGLHIDAARLEDGHYPANVVVDEQAAEFIDEETGETRSGSLLPGYKRNTPRMGHGKVYSDDEGDAASASAGRTYDYGGSSASRFYYCAKASTLERSCGGEVRNNHPTVKPLELMRWLCRLTETPTKGTVLDPFMGSGSTGVAAVLEGRPFIGIEREEESFWIAVERIKRAGALPRADAPSNPKAPDEGQIDLW